jgi:hypothetical protein
MESLNYNIHDLLGFSIIRNKNYRFRDLINLKYTSFMTNTNLHSDIILNIGDFSPSNNDCYSIDHLYYVKDNYFFCEEKEGKIKW